MESVVSYLKSAREKQNVSLAQMAADIKISRHYLESLEEGRFKDLPGGMYNRRAIANDSTSISRRF